MGSHFSSFIVDLMIPTYRACAADSGTGTQARMRDIWKRRLNRRDLFQLIRNRIDLEMQALFDEKTDALRNQAIEMSESIRRQLESFSGPEVEARRRHPNEVEMVRKVTQSADSQNLALQDKLRKLERHNSSDTDD
ncbi:MAG: hypothetical protein Q9222_003812 [Ikaeria aurantiellina]